MRKTHAGASARASSQVCSAATVLLVLSSGCGFVARTHAGNLPHVRATFRAALEYPGYAFVHVLAGCVTYQTPSYAEEIYRRCDPLPEGYDPTDFNRAVEAARAERFALGVLYRRAPERAPGSGAGRAGGGGRRVAAGGGAAQGAGTKRRD